MLEASLPAITAAPAMKPSHRPEGDQVDVGSNSQSQPSHCLRKTYSRTPEVEEAEVRQRTCKRGEALPPYCGSWSSEETASPEILLHPGDEKCRLSTKLNKIYPGFCWCYKSVLESIKYISFHTNYPRIHICPTFPLVGRYKLPKFHSMGYLRYCV